MIELNNMLVLDTFWFNGGGIVLLQDQVTFEYKIYAGSYERSGPMPNMPDIMTKVDEDIASISAYGTKLPKATINGFFPGVIIDESQSAKEVNPGYFLWSK